MKNYLLLALAIFSFSGCMNLRNSRVESDYSYAGNFKKYKTFNFITYRTNTDSSRYNPMIEEAIKARLQLQGYKYTDDRPDILAAYNVFYEDVLFKGYDQTDLEIWLERTGGREEEEPEDPKEIYKPIKYAMTKGTLQVVLIEKKRNRAVWQGYASGIMGEEGFTNDMYLNRAVRSIFDRYRVFTRGFFEPVERRN
jgi:hypothetical protein